LIDTVNDAWREHSKAFVIKLRGKHFAKMYGRFMKTVIEAAKEGKLVEAKQEQENGGI